MTHRRILGTPGDDIGANALIGNDQRNTLFGLAGDDFLDGAGQRDQLFGGDGNDILIYDRADRIKHGGAGIDTLRIVDDGQQITLGSKSHVKHIEAIDFASTDNHLRLRTSDIKRISDDDTLTVTGDHGNLLDPGSGWQLLGFSADGRFYHFVQSDVSLLVETDIQVVGFNQSEPLVLTDAPDHWFSTSTQSPGLTDDVHGGGGDDFLHSANTMAQLFGDTGDDSILSSGHGSVLRGGDGNDHLYAPNIAAMFGEAGNDTITFFGGGLRIASGGDGRDSFEIRYIGGTHYRILDFSVAAAETLVICSPPDKSLSPAQLSLEPVPGIDDMFDLVYREPDAPPISLATLVGTDLSSDALLPLIQIV